MAENETRSDAAPRDPPWRVPANWAAYTALCTAFIYIAGYLSLRSHYTALGISTDLGTFNQQYLFAGDRFLLYAGRLAPIFLLTMFVCWLIGFAVLKLISAIPSYRWKKPFSETVKAIRQYGLQATSAKLYVLSVSISLTMIQLFLVKCYFFTNLLLQRSLPNSKLDILITGRDSGHLSGYVSLLYFSFLMTAAAAVLTVHIVALSRDQNPSTAGKPLRWISVFLLSIQIAFLPINYGFFIDSRSVPQVTLTGDSAPELSGKLWLLAEGDVYLTLLAQKANWVIVSVRKDKIRRMESLCFNDVFRVRFQYEFPCSPVH